MYKGRRKKENSACVTFIVLLSYNVVAFQTVSFSLRPLANLLHQINIGRCLQPVLYAFRKID